MKKIVFTFSLFLLFAFPFNGLAHTYLSSSTPEDGQVLTQPVEEIVLQFETEVEELSTMSLYRNDELVEIDVRLTDHNQLIGDIPEELVNGDYVADWSIIGEDGHPIEGVISFSIKARENTDTNRTEYQNIESAESQEDVPESVVPIILTTLFALITIAGIWLLFRTRKK
ncbi:copper resistance CopC family protein [Jeotgalibacillus terrae]|uniref:Copper resistance protein CopC n=1 Tax=Jeotgalibacillus terrae TaxID=587735 RepID=A0ABW5ZIG5_9BACL|nr:copper resistance protein CopC [Jeotgalibacillus terrae]